MAPFPTAVARAVPREVISKLWTQRVTRVSLGDLHNVGRHVLETKRNTAFLVPAQFLHQELPIRISQTLRMLNSPDIPCILSSTAHFSQIREKCYEQISLLTSTPKPDSPEKEQKFIALLRALQDQCRQSMLSMRQAFKDAIDITEVPSYEMNKLLALDKFFDQFYSMNLGTNLLIGGHLALHDEGRNLVQKINPVKIAEQAINDARHVCEKHYDRVPNVEIISTNPSITTTYIEEHLRCILFEILKSSLQATIDFHATSSQMPPLKLIIVDGAEDVSIKLSDRGGGVPFSAQEKVWSYVYNSSRIKKEATRANGESVTSEIKDCSALPLYEDGYELPIARLLLRYFGGDLSLVSMEGYGTDTYVSLYRDDTQLENFPELPQTTSFNGGDNVNIY